MNITVDLLSAVDFLLRHCGEDGQYWYFEKDSEVHMALAEAKEQAEIALGIKRPEFPTTAPIKKECAA